MTEVHSPVSREQVWQTDDVDGGTIARLEERSLFVRLETVRLISIAKTGHYASTFSCAEILAALYYDTMRLRRGDPGWVDRDRFLMGKGHAAVGLYPLLVDWGFFGSDILNEYTRIGNPLGDHPDMTKVPGVDFSSGSLGHNLSVGLGMALGARFTGRDFNVYALLGDGELLEGQIWEAAAAASHYDVSNLIAIVDRNGYCLDGQVDDVIQIEPIRDRFESFGWQVEEVDGHDLRALVPLLRRLSRSSERTTPVVVIAHTVKGKGIKYMEEDFGWHLGWLNAEDEAAAYAELKGGLNHG